MAKKVEKKASGQAKGTKKTTRRRTTKASAGEAVDKQPVKGRTRSKASEAAEPVASDQAAGPAKPAAQSRPIAQPKSAAVAKQAEPANSGSSVQTSPASAARPAPKKTNTTAVVAAPSVAKEPLSDAQLRKVKTGLTKAILEQYRTLLLQKRGELLGDVEALESDARNDSGDHFSPEHMADIGSNNYEQEFTLGLVESEQRLLREIDEAVLRIRNRTYGVCVESGEPIGKPRLDAKPWAKYCIAVAREKERLGQL